jgi:septum formation inhibitor MinC
MISKVVEDIKNAPESIKNAPQILHARKEVLQGNLKAQKQQLQERGEALISKAKSQINAAKNSGQERWWNLETSALEAAEGLLGKADETVLAKWANGLEDLVTKRLDAVTLPGIENFDALNAKDTIKSLKGLDWLELLKVARYEQLTKDRKTVLKAVEGALNGLQN